MKKVRAWVSIGFVGGEHEEIIEYEDDWTDADIDKDVMLWSDNYVEVGWEIVE